MFIGLKEIKKVISNCIQVLDRLYYKTRVFYIRFNEILVLCCTNINILNIFTLIWGNKINLLTLSGFSNDLQCE